jgi:hypothetical protein
MSLTPKFKIGDIVKVSKNAPYLPSRNMIGTILSANSIYDKEFDENTHWYRVEFSNKDLTPNHQILAIKERNLSLLLTPETNKVFGDILTNI